MKKLVAFLIGLTLLICCCGPSCKPSPKCLKESCHKVETLIMMFDGNGGFYYIPTTSTQCECLEYEVIEAGTD